MRVVGVSRILNEGELIEAFVRHHATLLDLHIILDNGSRDRTLEVLRALRAEGLALRVYQTESPIFLEDIYNTGLFGLAKAAGADWVCFLDADELLDVRLAPPGLAAWLGGVPPATACLRVPVFRYRGIPDATEPNPFKQLTRRERQPHMHKIIIRGTVQEKVGIYPGNHGALIGGVATEGAAQDHVRLSHFPERTALQAARKAILGRMKALASGADTASRYSTHYAAPLEMLARDPGRWMAAFEEEAAAAMAAGDLVDDPADWRGGLLRHTSAPHHLADLIGQFAAYAGALAASHGALLDRSEALRAEAVRRGTAVRPLF